MVIPFDLSLNPSSSIASDEARAGLVLQQKNS
jgi:hypothetical protein